MSETANAPRRVEWRPADASRRAYAGYCRGRRIAHLSRQGAESGGDRWEISIGTDSDWPAAGALPWADAVAWVEARVAWLTALPGASPPPTAAGATRATPPPRGTGPALSPPATGQARRDQADGGAADDVLGAGARPREAPGRGEPEGAADRARRRDHGPDPPGQRRERRCPPPGPPSSAPSPTAQGGHCGSGASMAAGPAAVMKFRHGGHPPAPAAPRRPARASHCTAQTPAVFGRRLTVGKLAEAIGLDYQRHRRAWATVWLT